VCFQQQLTNPSKPILDNAVLHREDECADGALNHSKDALRKFFNGIRKLEGEIDSLVDEDEQGDCLPELSLVEDQLIEVLLQGLQFGDS
jgi:hypothetical protein